MKICMMTNTFLPHVGGVARSVHTFSEAFRKRGHQVLVVAPTFEDDDNVAGSRGKARGALAGHSTIQRQRFFSASATDLAG